MFTFGRDLLLLFALFAPISDAAAQSATAIASIPVATRQGMQIRDVRIGDVVVSIAEVPPKGARLDIANDPRFHYVQPLDGVSAQIAEGNLALQTARYEDWFSKTAPDPSLYAAPVSMSVFPNPRVQPGFVVRMDNTIFLGMKPYVMCRRVENPRRAYNNCTVDAALTDTVTLHLSFSDNRIPVNAWPEFLKSIEVGIREVVSRCETSLFAEHCSH